VDPKRRPKEAKDPTIRESKGALLEAAQAAIKERRDMPRPLPPGSLPPTGFGRTVFRLTLMMLMAAGALVLASQPSWLAGPKLPVETPAVRAASATLSLVDAMSRVRAYSDVRGKLPARLEDAGVENPGIIYRVVDNTNFEVSVAAGDSIVSLRSTDSLRPRLVDALLTLQRRA
jgi:hypothetical protein